MEHLRTQLFMVKELQHHTFLDSAPNVSESVPGCVCVCVFSPLGTLRLHDCGGFGLLSLKSSSVSCQTGQGHFQAGSAVTKVLSEKE